MSPIASAHPNRRVRRLVGILTASAVALTLAACSTPAGGDAGPRVYESEFGPVELPEKIERIVSVDFYTPAALLDIGVTPVGVVNTYFTDPDAEAIPAQYTKAITASDAESVGEYYELNLEAIVKADPDVVLATKDFLPLDDPMRKEIEKVAPIVTFTARDGDSWRVRADELAEILGKQDEIAPIREEYETRRDAFVEKYADIIDEYTFAVFQPDPEEWGTYGPKHFSTAVLADLGVTFREQEPDEITEDGFPEWFSYESIDRLANADIILIPVGEDQEVLDMLAANTVWNNLPAVTDGHVFDYVPRSPTGSYGWAIDNLDSFEGVFAEIQKKIDAQR